ncbi:DUF555 domain-containing protein [Salinirubellus salinus]|uniref:UPF0212 protein N0B31_06870 n=1 Tax=Salinirubellus salinus TaxID=1364945 RepID=A0A9E7R7A0_9EURY|nr:DUF555 domain-containing protein [Salinirubellus salinus]UWM56005.1 DUF555 domain-containing protein [Salinirubellus salinus]
MDCRVVVEAAVPVYDVGNTDEAVRIAISKTGEMLNPDLNYVEIEMGTRACPDCDESLPPAFVAADEALVALELEMTVFNVEGERHASRITRKEVGQRLDDIPLKVLEVSPVDEETDDEPPEPQSPTEQGESGTGADTGAAVDADERAGEESTDGDGDEGVLPEFEELLEDR